MEIAPVRPVPAGRPLLGRIKKKFDEDGRNQTSLDPCVVDPTQ